MTYRDLNIDVRGPEHSPAPGRATDDRSSDDRSSDDRSSDDRSGNGQVAATASTSSPENGSEPKPTRGDPLLLLHGWGSSAEHMRPVAQALADGHATHAVDLPGHGKSPPPPEPWGVPEHAQCLTEYIQQEIQTKVTIIGHSNGGRLALYLAATPETADLIRRLVLVSPSGVRPERSWTVRARSGVAKALKAPVQALPEPVRAPALDWLRHSAVWKLLGSSDYNAASGVMRETFVKTVNYHLDDVLDQISIPTLLFWGTDDEAVSRRQMQVLEETIPDCGLVELPGAGHYGHLEQFDTFISATRYFLQNS